MISSSLVKFASNMGLHLRDFGSVVEQDAKKLGDDFVHAVKEIIPMVKMLAIGTKMDVNNFLYAASNNQAIKQLQSMYQLNFMLRMLALAKKIEISPEHSNELITPLQLDMLPPELLARIFQYLDIESLKKATQVSKLFYSIINELPLTSAVISQNQLAAQANEQFKLHTPLFFKFKDYWNLLEPVQKINHAEAMGHCLEWVTTRTETAKNILVYLTGTIAASGLLFHLLHALEYYLARWDAFYDYINKHKLTESIYFVVEEYYDRYDNRLEVRKLLTEKGMELMKSLPSAINYEALQQKHLKLALAVPTVAISLMILARYWPSFWNRVNDYLDGKLQSTVQQNEDRIRNYVMSNRYLSFAAPSVRSNNENHENHENHENQQYDLN